MSNKTQSRPAKGGRYIRDKSGLRKANKDERAKSAGTVVNKQEKGA